MGTQVDQSFPRRKLLLAAGGLFLAACANAATIGVRTTKVLFVCRAGTVKSPIAREHFRRMAVQRGVAASASARGIAPEDHVSPELEAALRADAIEIRSEPVQRLARDDLASADIIVVFDALPEDLGVWPVRDWSDLPSMNADYRAAREVLISRLSALLDEIASAARERTRA